MPDIKSAVSNPKRAAAGALLQRQSMTLSGLYNEAEQAYESARKDGVLTGDIAKNTADKSCMGFDAFRHAYASARATQELGGAIASTLGRGNEWLAAAVRENDVEQANAADIGMDLHNNKTGRDIAHRLGAHATPAQIRDAVIEAGNRGELILSTKDSRALKEYASQYDMIALAVAHDAVTQGPSAVKDAATALWDKAKGAVDSVRDVAGDVKTRLEHFGKSLNTALEQDGRSPFFLFSEAELKAGEKHAALAHPGLLATVERSVEMGPEMSLDRETLKDIMHPVEQFAQRGHENAHERSAAENHQQYAQNERQPAHEQSEHEMEHDMA